MKKKRYILLFILTLTVLAILAPPIYAAAVILRAPTVEANVGGTLDVPIEIANANGAGALHTELVYDPALLKAVSVTVGAAAGKNALLESNVNKTGRVVIGIVAPDSITTDGTLATIRFQALGNSGASSPLTFENNAAWERASYAEMLVQAEAGKVTIAAGAPSWLIPALIGLAVLFVFLVLLIFVFMRRKPTPRSASLALAYTPPQSQAPPPARAAASPPTYLPEGKMSASQNPAPFKRAEDEYFKLKGQLATGRLTHAQFENKLRELMVQDAQGRYWMLGADTGKWYVHEGKDWVERSPF